MGIARVVFNKRSLVDVTQDTVKEEYLMAGKTALGADGEVVEGSAREDHENDVVQGTLGGTYTNADLVKVGNCGLYRATDRQGSDTSINFPNVEIVEDLAFYGNVKLVSATLSKASIIGSSAFRYCSVLSDVSLPAAKTIHISAFASCLALSTISLPEATVIGSWAFQSCTTLVSADLPKVTKIHDSAFSQCSLLGDLNLPYGCSPGAGTFYGCSHISYWVHDSTGIYTACFQNCINLLAVDVSTTFNATRQNMFANCQKLSIFIIRKNAVVALSHTNCFSSTPFASGKTGGALYVPSAYVDSYKAATNWATILGYENNQILPIEGSIYEFFFADGRPINEKPLYPLDGTYVNTENDTQIVIENGHWHITAQYTGGTKTINLFQFPAAAVSGQRTWKGTITNFNQITSGGGMGGINGANDWSQSYEICGLGSGDQENSIQITPTSPESRLWYLRYGRPYGAAFECEFDFELYVDDVWYC